VAGAMPPGSTDRTKAGSTKAGTRMEPGYPPSVADGQVSRVSGR
jgi:hypothetical protein